MVKKEMAYRRLSYNKGDNTYKLTIPPEIVISNEWQTGQTLYLRNHDGVLYYKDKEDPLSRKLKIQYQKGINVYSVRIPARIVGHCCFRPGQQFIFSSGKGWVQYNPFNCIHKLTGVAEKKRVKNNLPKPVVSENVSTN